MKSSPGSIVSIKSSSGKKLLYYKLTFLHDKKLKHKKHKTGLVDTKSNRKIVEEILEHNYKKFLIDKNFLPNDEVAEFSVHELFEKFSDYSINIKGRSEKTIENYKRALILIIPSDYLISKLYSNSGNRLVYQIEKDIERFVNESDLSANSKRIYLRGFSSFLNYCFDEGVINPFNIKRYFPKQTKKEPKTYPSDILEKLINYFKDVKPDKDLELWIRFIILTGSRNKESIRLEFNENVDFDNKILLFPNKINKERLQAIPMTEELFDLVKELETRSRKRNINTHKLFKWNESSVRYLQLKVSEALKYYGVKEKGFNIHPIRKSFITNLIDKGVAPQHVQKLARHANFNTTIQHYYDADIDLLRKEMGR